MSSLSISVGLLPLCFNSCMFLSLEEVILGNQPSSALVILCRLLVFSRDFTVFFLNKENEKTVMVFEHQNNYYQYLYKNSNGFRL